MHLEQNVLRLSVDLMLGNHGSLHLNIFLYVVCLSALKSWLGVGSLFTKKAKKSLSFRLGNFLFYKYIYTSVDATVKYIILREINLSCFWVFKYKYRGSELIFENDMNEVPEKESCPCAPVASYNPSYVKGWN